MRKLRLREVKEEILSITFQSLSLYLNMVCAQFPISAATAYQRSALDPITMHVLEGLTQWVFYNAKLLLDILPPFTEGTGMNHGVVNCAGDGDIYTSLWPPSSLSLVKTASYFNAWYWFNVITTFISNVYADFGLDRWLESSCEAMGAIKLAIVGPRWTLF